MQGSILLHRALLESYAFSNETTLKIWIWLLLKANWKEGYVDIKTGEASTTILVGRGQFVFGRNKAEKELNIPASTIERHMKKLEAKLQIVRKVNRHYSLVTVCNYDSYQSTKNKSEQPLNNHRTTTEQPLNTNNKDNKDNKGNKQAGEIFRIMRQMTDRYFSDKLLMTEAIKFLDKYGDQKIYNVAALVGGYVKNLKPDCKVKFYNPGTASTGLMTVDQWENIKERTTLTFEGYEAA